MLRSPIIFFILLVAFAAGSSKAQNSVDLTKAGVVGDGVTLNTTAIQQAIDACSAQGGGTLTFPAGRYLTGTIQLKARVTLHVDAGAVILGSPHAVDYRNLDPFVAGDGVPLGDALIVAVDAHHVGVDGPGLIDGQGHLLRAAQTPYKVRPFLMRWLRCTDVTVKDLHLTNPGAWTLNFFQSRDLTVEHVTIRTRETGLANNDGIDLDSCEGALIRDCDIESGDDALCFKATSPLPCRDIVASGCKLSTKCNAIKLGTESLGDFAQISVSHCEIRNTGMAGIALYCVDGAQLHDVSVSDISMDGITVPISIRLGARLKTFRAGDTAKPPGQLRDIAIRNVRATGARQIGILVNGVPGHPVENLTLENIDIALPGGGTAEQARLQLAEKEAAYPEYSMFGKVMPASGIYLRHVRGIRLNQVRTTVAAVDARPETVFVDVEGVTPVDFVHASTPTSAPTADATTLQSPDGQLAVEFKLTANRAPVYLIRRNGRIVLPESRLGLIRDDADFSRGLTLAAVSPVEAVADDYEILTAKRRHNSYRGNRRVFHLATADGKKLDVIFQVSNDGIAFRYFFPETSAEVHQLKEEVSSFHFLAGTTAWLQPMSVAKSGWKATNPAYEEYYAQAIPVGTPSTLGAGWAYPALFQSSDVWLLVSEGSLGRNYCGTRLRHESPDGEYTVGFADPRETIPGQSANPSSTLPWLTPWHLIAVGSLRTIVESTLGTDLAEKPPTPANTSVKPGKASWSWAALGDKQTVYDVQKRFIDYAAEMGWAYCLIDALWDTQIGYPQMKELAEYARGKNVGLLLWYNSNGALNDAPQTPKDKLTTHELRVQEFDRLKAMGIQGLKVDFFGGDGQPIINYYHDLLEDAAPYGFLMNFHGTTLPRGWQRTYPHLMTMEAIRGFEYITFEQKNADEEPVHAATIPFTRNVFDPMDFTPVCLDKTGRTKLVTTKAFELALAVIFTSGVQHYPDAPEGMAKMPDYVKAFMRAVPSVWDDSKFIDGFPGKLAVIARQGDGRWYVAGINGEATEKTLALDLGRLAGADATGVLITDGDDNAFSQQPVKLDAEKKLSVVLKPHGGFVLTLGEQPLITPAK